MPKTSTKRQTRRVRNLGMAFLIVGLFVVGAVIVFALSDVQDKALESSGFTIPPASSSFAAPELNLSDLQGNPASLAAYRGQVVLVNNWATWCPPCKAELPEIQDYYAAHAEAGFVVVAIESGDSASTVSNFVKQNRLTFPVWLDPGGAAANAFHNWGLPNSYVIDRDGIVRMSWTGQINLATLEQYVTPLLDE
jgi:cytochrome c biogenesis protein CcmG/thiol:disulfide interchange protein DsbE